MRRITDSVSVPQPGLSIIRKRCRIFYWQSDSHGDVECERNSLFASTTFTGDVTHSARPSFSLEAFLALASTASMVSESRHSRTFLDTTSNGTVATAYTDVLGGNTITATNPTTITNYVTQYVKDPIAGSGITLSNKYAIGADSLRIGTSNQLTVSNSGVLTAVSPVFTTNFTSPAWKPTSDSTTAIQINKADGTTNVLNVDTTNGRLGLGRRIRPIFYPSATVLLKGLD